MLMITVVGQELYDESTNTFSTVGDVVLHLEHSLISLSKWESEFEKPFLSPGEKTNFELITYIKYMIITPGDFSDSISNLSKENLDLINEYIESKQSATTFGEMPKPKGKSETITSELIYYWMITFSIPFECQYWHLNRLFSLIRICNLKNSKPKRMSRRELSAKYRELNERRRAELGTTG